MNGCAVVGIGTADRGDDAVGLLVVDRVRELQTSGVTVVPVATPLELLDVFDAYDNVVVVDATRTGADAGAVSVHVVDGAPLGPRSGAAGTHGLGLPEVVELARALDRLPGRLVVVGVELTDVSIGADITDVVVGAIEQAAAEVMRAAGTS